eukprot:COSAG05_NODE_4_length_49189_cov_157.128784_6_plen_103_part_00
MRIGNLAASSFQSVTATEDDGSSPMLQYLRAAQAVEEHAKKERKLQDEEKLQETGGQDLEALFEAPTRVISACRSRAPGARAWQQQTVTSDVDAAGLATLHG